MNTFLMRNPRTMGLQAPHIKKAADPKDNTGWINLTECGCCGCWHPVDFIGIDCDCRNDANRLHPDDLQELMPNVVVMEDGNPIDGTDHPEIERTPATWQT